MFTFTKKNLSGLRRQLLLGDRASRLPGCRSDGEGSDGEGPAVALPRSTTCTGQQEDTVPPLGSFHSRLRDENHPDSQ